MLCDELHMCGTHGEKKELPSLLLLAAAAVYTRLNKWNIEGFFGVFSPSLHISKSLSHAFCLNIMHFFYHYFKPTFVVVCPKFQHHPKNSMKNAVGAGRVHTSR